VNNDHADRADAADLQQVGRGRTSAINGQPSTNQAGLKADAQELSEIARELRAIAAFGLNFAANPFDEERYQAVLSASARLEAFIQGEEAESLLHTYRQNAFSLSAMPSTEAVVLDKGRILLVQRKDDGLWALPGGITDPGETLAESAKRELWEETGVRGRIRQLLGLFDSRLWQSDKRIHFYHALFLIEAEDPVPRPSPEVFDAAYFEETSLPPLSSGHHLRVPFVFRQLRGEAPIPYFDDPS
jgi:ADP-ribose pyrophosphatase YjhB (NUDIX family)